MRFAAFVFLLVVAGVAASPQAEVAPTDSRIVDLWLQNAIAVARGLIKERGLDPGKKEDHSFEYNAFNWLTVAGHAQKILFTGMSNIAINNLHYNIILSRLGFDLALPELNLSLSKLVAEAFLGDFSAAIELDGSIQVVNVRLVGDALITVNPGWVNLYNINVNFSIGKIKSEFTAYSGDREVSDYVNGLFNDTIPELLNTFANDINTIIAQFIRERVNFWW